MIFKMGGGGGGVTPRGSPTCHLDHATNFRAPYLTAYQRPRIHPARRIKFLNQKMLSCSGLHNFSYEQEHGALEKIYCTLIIRTRAFSPPESQGHKAIISKRGRGVKDTPGSPFWYAPVAYASSYFYPPFFSGRYRLTLPMSVLADALSAYFFSNFRNL